MTSEFLPAFAYTFPNEGGYCVDRGGPTNYGITVPFLRRLGLRGDFDGDGDVDASDVRLLTPERAQDAYKELIWDIAPYRLLASQGLANRVYDADVNMGAFQAAKILQRAACAVGRRVVDDGWVGPKTIEAANAARPEEIISAFRSEMAGVYRMICARDPSAEENRVGWLERAYRFP